MTILLIQTKDGHVYADDAPLHFMVAEKFKVEFDEIQRVGFVTRDREVWEDRKPH